MTDPAPGVQELSLAEQYEITGSVETLLELWLVDNACNESLDPESPRYSSGGQDAAALGDWLINALVRSGEASLRIKGILSRHPDLINSRVESLPERQGKVTAVDLDRLRASFQERGQSPASWAEQQIDGLVRAVSGEIRSVTDRNDRIAAQQPVDGDISHATLCFLGGATFAASSAGGPLLQAVIGYEVYSECF